MKVTIDNREDAGEIKVPSLWVRPDVSTNERVYLLQHVGNGYCALSLNAIGRWGGPYHTLEEAVDGLVPFHGSVLLEAE